VYNPAQNTWSFGSPLPSPTCCSGAVTVPGGQIYVVNGGMSAGSQFAIYGPSVFLAPAAGAPGSTAAVTGTNFAPAATVSLFWGAANDGHLLATGATDSSGTTTTPLSFTVPATATPGTYTLTALDDQSQYPVTTTFVVPPAQPTIAALSTASGGYGQAVSTTGTDFVPREAVGLFWDRLTSPLTATVSTASGAFHTAFRVPNTTAGVHYLIALGLRSHRLTYRRFVVRPRTFLAKPTAAPGTPNALVALGFAAHDTVHVYWRSPGGTLLGTITTNAAGSGTLSFTTPAGTPATYNVISSGQAVGGLSTLTLTP
jgi:catechol 2,3-dioxygenase-like lactoylglutathione lyase family enzyme